MRVRVPIIVLLIVGVAATSSSRRSLPRIETEGVAGRKAPSTSATVWTGEHHPTADWMRSFPSLFGGGREVDPLPEAPPRPVPSKYRTVCVRLCDGFFWPISHATTRDRFVRDTGRCEKSCPSRSRLFVHRSDGEGVEDMVDTQGRSYRKLETAFLFRSQYLADCTCWGNPWEQAAVERHRTHAERASSGRETRRAETRDMRDAGRSGERRHRSARSEQSLDGND